MFHFQDWIFWAPAPRWTNPFLTFTHRRRFALSGNQVKYCAAFFIWCWPSCIFLFISSFLNQDNGIQMANQCGSGSGSGLGTQYNSNIYHWPIGFSFFQLSLSKFVFAHKPGEISLRKLVFASGRDWPRGWRCNSSSPPWRDFSP